MTPEEVQRRVQGIAEDQNTANDRFKNSFSTWVAGGLVLATLAHFALFELFPTMRAADVKVTGSQTEAVELPPEVEIPPPPKQVARPATPKVSAAADVSEDVTISKTTFEGNPVEQLPPPPKSTGGKGGEEDRPEFIPYDVPPELKNSGEVQRYLQRVYPPSLKESSIGGTVTLWVYVDETGTVEKTRVHNSSGYDALDAAAQKVADRMEFSPAMNRDKKTAVWVQQRIHFQVK